jgi:BON domain
VQLEIDPLAGEALAQGAMVFLCAKRRSIVMALPAVVLGGWICWAPVVCADNSSSPADERLEQIIVTARKRPQPVPDEVLTGRVQAALKADPFFYDEHVTVTIKNGVVTLEGIVFDEWDVHKAIRIAKKIAGVRRVVTDFYIPDGM